SVVNCEKILNLPSDVPRPTVKWRLKTCPGRKVEGATNGRTASLGQKVRKPPFEVTTLALPTKARALFAIVRPSQVPRTGCKFSVPPVIGKLLCVVQPVNPGRVSNSRTGCGSGLKSKPTPFASVASEL